ncbi:DNA nucleotidylexotransferase [Anabarilius grahami]|uniref:DNA nucleotidylexotransferase n=1 Tax=Anabarilius grahami TaxID=495550 RepID=A0A3N0XXQ2_ANAGA|nr:DNA nucleotidylexotransferase [Anabarilius grahami]
MFSTALPTRKRRRPEVAFTQGREEVKFGDVKVYLVERRMGKSRRNFLSNLARSKGFCVDDALRCTCMRLMVRICCLSDIRSGNVTHVVSEGNAAQELWNWLEEQGLGEMQDKHVLNVSWFTESMSAGQPVPVELRHYIQWGYRRAEVVHLASPPTVPEKLCSRHASRRTYDCELEFVF